MSGEVSRRIHEFISGRYPDIQLGVDDDIFALGFINSLFAMELVMFIEKTFGFTVANRDLRIDNFRTVGAMAALIENQAVAAGQGSGR
jgi:methoxymalonate biosynthesis acyl carrier protein